ncbi:hypothetical protein [Photorhabdus viridis]|uniref:hypothetical protein n=1 Tax=Photorhabdus viridis TaxID=3163327 RepID=UPI003307860F
MLPKQIKLISCNVTPIMTASLFIFLIINSIHKNNIEMELIAGSCCIIYLISSISFWWKKTSARSGILIFAVCFIVLISGNRLSSISISDLMHRYLDVFWLLLGVGLLRQVMLSLPLDHFLRSLLVKNKPRYHSLLIAGVTIFMTLPMSLGAIPLIIDSLKRLVEPRLQLAMIVSRMVSITMVLIPITIGAATVYSAMPKISLSETALLGIPLLIFSLILNERTPVNIVNDKDEANANAELPELSRIIIFTVLFWSGILISLLILKFNSLQSLAITSGIIFVIDRLSGKHSLMNSGISTATQSISSEILLLLSCSLLVSTVSLYLNSIPSELSQWVSDLYDWQKYAVILFILPIFSIVGLHPLILFSLAWSLFSPYISGSAADYQVWICLFISTQLLSPVSINAVFVANSLSVSTIDTSYRMHARYVFLFNFFALIYLSIISILL